MSIEAVELDDGASWAAGEAIGKYLRDFSIFGRFGGWWRFSFVRKLWGPSDGPWGLGTRRSTWLWKLLTNPRVFRPLPSIFENFRPWDFGLGAMTDFRAAAVLSTVSFGQVCV